MISLIQKLELYFNLLVLMYDHNLHQVEYASML